MTRQYFSQELGLVYYRAMSKTVQYRRNVLKNYRSSVQDKILSNHAFVREVTQWKYKLQQQLMPQQNMSERQFVSMIVLKASIQWWPAQQLLELIQSLPRTHLNAVSLPSQKANFSLSLILSCIFFMHNWISCSISSTVREDSPIHQTIL